MGHLPPLARRLVGFLLCAACFGALLAPPALASTTKRRRYGTGGDGRMYDPSRLRTNATRQAPGRYMRRPEVPEPEMPRELRSTATIPDPTPNLRGGTGYERRGKYFYREADEPVLSRRAGRADYRAAIPSPDQERVTRSGRGKSAAR